MSTFKVRILATSLAFFASGAFAEPLRVVQDPARNRTWRLERDAVYVQEAAKTRRIELPGWLHADDSWVCRPDLAVDARGTAVVTSNVAPIVWRIDPETSAVSQHELVLDAEQGREVGFTGLTYASDQDAFFAVSATQGSLWRIDPMLRRAQKIPTSEPMRNACSLAVERTKTRRTVVLCVRGLPAARRVHLTPDQRSAYVRYEACLEQAADADVAFFK